LRQAVIGDKCLRPDGVHQLVFRHDSFPVCDQEQECFEGLAGEQHHFAVAEQLLARDVDAEPSEFVRGSPHVAFFRLPGRIQIGHGVFTGVKPDAAPVIFDAPPILPRFQKLN